MGTRVGVVRIRAGTLRMRKDGDRRKPDDRAQRFSPSIPQSVVRSRSERRKKEEKRPQPG